MADIKLKRWPWWRVLCAALTPWVATFSLIVLGAPEWAAVGLGLVIFVQTMIAAAHADALRALADASPSSQPATSTEEGDHAR